MEISIEFAILFCRWRAYHSANVYHRNCLRESFGPAVLISTSLLYPLKIRSISRSPLPWSASPFRFLPRTPATPLRRLLLGPTATSDGSAIPPSPRTRGARWRQGRGGHGDGACEEKASLSGWRAKEAAARKREETGGERRGGGQWRPARRGDRKPAEEANLAAPQVNLDGPEGEEVVGGGRGEGHGGACPLPASTATSRTCSSAGALPPHPAAPCACSSAGALPPARLLRAPAPPLAPSLPRACFSTTALSVRHMLPPSASSTADGPLPPGRSRSPPPDQSPKDPAALQDEKLHAAMPNHGSTLDL